MGANSYPDIEGALNAKLAANFTDTLLVYENAPTEDGQAPAPEGVTHIEAYFLPGPSEQIEVGVSGKDRAVGIYQLTVRTPVLKGKYEGSELVKRLEASYVRGTALALNGVSVRIRSNAYPVSGRRNGGYYEVPVTVNWYSDS